MAEHLLLIAAAVTAYAGFACLALSQTRHWRQVPGSTTATSPPKTSLRTTGALCLAVSLALALLRDGSAFGSLLWVVLVSVCAFAVALTLSWRAGWLRIFVVPASNGTGDQLKGTGNRRPRN